MIHIKDEPIDPSRPVRVMMCGRSINPLGQDQFVDDRDSALRAVRNGLGELCDRCREKAGITLLDLVVAGAPTTETMKAVQPIKPSDLPRTIDRPEAQEWVSEINEAIQKSIEDTGFHDEVIVALPASWDDSFYAYLREPVCSLFEDAGWAVVIDRTRQVMLLRVVNSPMTVVRPAKPKLTAPF